MIKIAVVDNEAQERMVFVDFFAKLQAEIKEELDVHVYVSGDAFLAGYDDSYDLVCLDIDMEGKDGISTAAEVRKINEQVIIIFVTNMAQMAIRGYEVQALDFVIKPVNYFSFAMKMRNAVAIIKRRKNKSIYLSDLSGVRRIPTETLYYVEVDRHYLSYHTTEGIFRQKGSMKELEKKLEGLSFKRCNNCYLVNLKFVDCVNKDDLKIGGDWLKISRPRKKEFLRSLANYMGGIDE